MRDPDRWAVDRPGGNESHNSVAGLPAPVRILCRLIRGNKQTPPGSP
jgi:hypothetical protein